jgi:hypothetical protein
MEFTGSIRVLELLITGALLFTVGNIYAWRIARHPFPPEFTWLSVVIGDAITDAGMAAALYFLTGNVWLCLVPWLAHILTGAPMILGQRLKHHFQHEGSQLLRENNGNEP